MKIVDCFMFNNELDLLEIRFRELYNSVDLFVIVESCFSNTLRPKPYNFKNNQNRYSPWLDKVRYIQHVGPQSSDPWVNESSQRSAINEGLYDVESDDLVIVGDVDEIVRASCVDQLKNSNESMFGFRMPLFNFKFNYVRVDPEPYTVQTMAARGKWVKTQGAQRLRCLRDQPDQYHTLEHAGWHFGYLGNNQFLYDKALDTCHQEDIFQKFLDQLDVDKSIQERKCWNRWWPYTYEIVDLNDYFPESCRDFPQYCLPNSGIDIMNFLQ